MKSITNLKNLILVVLVFSFLSSTNIYGQEINKKNSKNQTTVSNENYSKSDWSNKGIFSKFKPSDEIVELRDKTSKHFLNPDGTRTAIIASGYSLNYFEDGKWNTISREIIPDKTGKSVNHSYSNTSNSFKSYYSASCGKNGIITNLKEGNILEWVNPKMYYIANGEKANILSTNPSIAKVQDNEILYPDGFNNIDIKFIQGNDGRKMDIILNNPQSLQNSPANASYVVFEETVQLPAGWTIKKNDGCINILNENNIVIARYEKPVCFDNNIFTNSEQDENLNTIPNKIIENSKIFCNYNVTIDGNNLNISILVPVQWLKDSQRKYPVVVDPTITIYPNSTQYWTGYVTAAGVKGNDSLYQISSTGNRGFMRFDISSLSSVSSISSATINFYCYSGTGSTATNNVYSLVNTDPVTATGATLYTACATGTAVASGVTATTPTWYNWTLTSAELTNIMNRKTTPGWEGYGLVRGGTILYSYYGYGNTTYKPYLSVTYCITPGVPISLASNVTGQTTVSLLWAAGTPVGSPNISYNWEVLTTGGSIVKSGNTTNDSVGVTGLSCGSIYYFSVQATTTCGNSSSAWVSSSNFTTVACCVIPGAPDTLSTTITSQTSATIQWTVGTPAGSGTISYYWEVYTTGGLLMSSSSTNNTQASIGSLTCGTLYYFRVQAYSNCGSGSYSNWAISNNFITDPCDILVPSSGENVNWTCSGHIYDYGGPTGYYGNNWNGYSVIYPDDTTKAVQLSGSYNTDVSDTIKIYYGAAGTGGTLIGSFAGTGNIPQLTSPGANVPLTISFITNGSVVGPGFDFLVTCATPCTTPPTSPSLLSTSMNNYCSNAGGTDSLKDQSTGGDSLIWYNGICGGTILGIGNPYVITAPVKTTMYYASWYTLGCPASSCSSITISVIDSAVAPVTAKVDTNNFCSNYAGNITLSSSGGSGTYLVWYSGSCGGTQIGTGSSLIKQAPSLTTSYYVNWTKTGCSNSSCAAINVVVNFFPSTPALAITSENNYCYNAGGNLSLSVSGGNGNHVRWYKTSCGGTSVGSGNPMIFTAPTASITYWGRWESTCGNSNCVSIYITVLAAAVTPASVSVDRNNLCSNDGGVINLSASAGSGNTLNWYTVSCGGTAIGTGKTVTRSTPTVNTIYWVRWSNTCGNTTCKSFTEVISALPIPPTAVTSSNNNFCAGSTSSISLSVSGGVGSIIGWYGLSCNSGSIGTGSPLTITSPTINTTYWVNRQQPTGCPNSSCLSIIISVYSGPTSPVSATVNRNNICANDGGSISLSESGGSGTTIGWFTASCSGTQIGTGKQLSLSSPTITTTYWVNWEIAGCSNSSCISITEIVTAAPVAPLSLSSDTNNYCSDYSGNITLFTSGGSGTTSLWSSTCGGSSIGNGTSLTLTAPLINTTYYNWWTLTGCNNSSCLSITIVVNTLPVTPDSVMTSRNNLCSNDGGNINLNIFGGAGTTVQWYLDGCEITNFGNGNPLTISAPTTTTTYWVNMLSPSCTNSGCLSLTVTINPVTPMQISAISDLNNFCYNLGGSINLSSTGGSGDILNWSSTSCGGTVIGTGEQLAVSAPTVTTTYWSNWFSSGCYNSSCGSVTVNVLQVPSSPGTINGSTNVCSGTQQVYTVAYVTGVNYSWTSPVGWTGTSSTNSITYTVNTNSGNVIVTPSNSCGNGSASALYVLLNSSSNFATSATASPVSLCPGASSTLSVVGGTLGTGAGWYWYSGSCGGTHIGTGTTLVYSPTATSTYYVRAESSCNSTICKTANITLNTLSVMPDSVSRSSTICSGNSATLSISGGFLGTGGVWRWYVTSCGGSTAGTGISVVKSPTITTTYWVRATGTCYTTSCFSTTISILTVPTSPGTISGNANSCPAKSITYSVTTHSGWSYSWTAPNDWTGSSTTNAITYLSGAISGNVSVTASNTCGTGPASSLYVNIYTTSTLPASLSASSSGICPGGNSVTITELNGILGYGAVWYWYSTSCGSGSAGTGISITKSPTVTTTYWIRASGTCNTTTCLSVYIPLYSLSTVPVSISATKTTICNGDSSVLTQTGGVLGSMANWYWYADSCGGTLSGIGTSIILKPTSTSIYWVRAEGQCNTTSCISLTITVMNVPSSVGPLTGVNSGCSGTSHIYTSTYFSGVTYSWSAPNGWTGTSTSNSITYTFSTTSGIVTVVPSNTCGNGSASSLWVNTYISSTIPTSVTANPASICQGYPTTLSEVGGTLGTGANWYWYSGSCGGANLVGTGPTIVQNPTVNTSYWVRAQGTCNTTSCYLVNVTINGTLSTMPTSVSSSPSTLCASGVSTISLSGGVLGTGAGWKWYNGSCGGTLTGTGVSTNQNITATSTYYVRAEGTCNTTSCLSIAVSIVPIPAPTNVTATPSLICTGSASSLNATSTGGYSIAWWSAATGGAMFGTSASTANYSVSPTTTTTYYAETGVYTLNTQTFTYVTTSPVTWTIPTGVNSLTIEAIGASGGYITGQVAGRGARMKGSFSVTGGQVLSILIGQCPGATAGANVYPGGGGGTFVALGATYSSATPLIVAGGGGGTFSGTGIDASIGTSGTGTNPGTNGNGAPAVQCGGGGGGFYTSGGNDTQYGYYGGKGFQQGGAASGATSATYQSGGVGGGAEADYNVNCNIRGGAGGGYSGGSGENDLNAVNVGQAGGSYNGGANQTNTAGYNTGNGQVTITYYTIGCTSSRSPVTVTVNPLSTVPTSVSALHNIICAGDQDSLSQTGGTLSIGANWNWYTASCGGTYVISGSPVLITPTVTTVYWVRAQGTCNTTTCLSVSVTVNNVAPTAVTATPATICSGSSSTLAETGGLIISGSNYYWYSGSCGGTIVISGVSVNVTPTITTTYWERVEGTCNTTSCLSVTVSVNPATVNPYYGIISLPSICTNHTTNISLSVSGGSGVAVRWYTVGCGTTSAGTGNPLSIAHPTVTTVYWGRWESTGCTSSICVSVTCTIFTVTAAPNRGITSNTNICASAGGTFSLSVSGGIGEYLSWFTASCGGTAAGTGQGLTLTAPTVTTIYWGRWGSLGTCGNSTCVSVTVTIISLANPTSAAANPSTVILGQTTTLTVAGTVSIGAIWRWYNGGCGSGTITGTGASLVTQPATTTTYYVRAENGTCYSNCVTADVTVPGGSLNGPGTVTATPDTICSGQSSTLSLNGTLNGGQWYWYSTSCGGAFIGTGSTIIVSPSVSTTYYVRQELGTIYSNCGSILLTVNTLSVGSTSITSNPAEICYGYSSTLAITGGVLGTNANWYWYSGSCGGIFENIGISIIVSPSITTNYYLRAEGSCNTTTCESLIIIVDPQLSSPTNLTSDTNNVCSSYQGKITLNLIGGSGSDVRWFNSSCGGTSIGTGNPMSVSTPLVSTTFYARWETNICGNSPCDSININVITAPVDPSSVSVDRNNLCSNDGGNINLSSAGGSGTILSWYDAGCGVDQIGNGQLLNIPAPTITTTYYARWESSNCGNSNCLNVTISVNTSPTPPALVQSDLNNFCSNIGGNITLSSIGGSGATLVWFSDFCDGTTIGNGSSLIISAPTTTTTYYADWQATGCNNSPCANVLVNVNSSPNDPDSANANPLIINTGESSNLNVFGNLFPGALWVWYEGGCGSGNSIGGGNTIILNPNVSTVYFVRAENALCYSNCVSTTISVNGSLIGPGTVSVMPNPVCSGQSATLSLTGSLNGGEWYWYTSNCGGILIGSGASPVINASLSDTYYVRQESGTLYSSCGNVSLNVDTLSSSATSANSTPGVICSGSSVILSLSGGLLGTAADWYWYSGSCGGILIGNGSGFSVSPITSTTYYVRAEGTCNTTVCMNTTVTVNNLSFSASSASVTPDTICQGASSTLAVLGGALGTGADWVWYSSSCSGTFVGNGSSITIAPTTTTTYFVRAEGSCNTTSCVNTTIFVNSISTSATFAYTNIPNSISYCSAGSTICDEYISDVICGNINNSSSCSNGGYIDITSLSTSVTVGNSQSITVVNGLFYTGDYVDVWIDFNQSGSFTDANEHVIHIAQTGDTTVSSFTVPVTATTGSTRMRICISNSSTTSSCGNTYYGEYEDYSINIQPSTQPQPLTICSGVGINLNETGGSLGTAANWNWYTGSCGGTYLMSGSSPLIYPTITTTYYVLASGICNTTNCVNTTVIVNTFSLPATSATGTTPICSGNSTTLSINGGSLGTGAIWKWYTGSCGGTYVTSGLSPVLSPTIATTYYVLASGTCNTTNCVNTTVLVNTLSTPVTSATGTTPICSGNNTTLNITGGSLGTGANWKWYTGSCGGAYLTSGASSVQSPTITTTYYVLASGTCNTTTCVSKTITLNTASVSATSVTANLTAVCTGTSSVLTLTGGSLGTGANWVWYSNSCGGTLQGNGTIISITVTPTASTTYYVRAEGTCATTICVNTTVTLNNSSVAATDASANPDSVCAGASSMLSVVGGTLGTGASWYWYSSCGGTLLGNGLSIIVTPTVSSTYYVRAEGTCNTTTCANINVTIITAPSQTSNITGNISPTTGNSETYSVTDVPGTNYSWTAPSGWSGSSSTNIISYIVGFPNGAITVTPYNSCGNGPLTSLSVGSSFKIDGYFTYYNSYSTPMDSAWIYLLQNGNIIDSIQSDTTGYYVFNGIPNGTYTITATTDKPWGGVNSTDAVKVKRDFAGSEYFTTSIQLHAADVNLSYSINTTDAVKITRRFVGSDTSFTRGDWVFEKPSGGDTLDVSTDYNDTVIVNGSNIIQNFLSLCVGDVNGSNVPSAKSSAKVQLDINNLIRLNSNEQFEIPVNVTNLRKIGAISLILNYPKELVSINSVRLAMNNNSDIFYKTKGNELRIGWFESGDALNLNNNESVIIISGKTTNNFKSGDIIKFSIADNILNEFADESGNPINNVILNTYSIGHINSSGIETLANNLYNDMLIYPNPAKDKLNINYLIAKDGLVKISLYNILGEKIIDVVNSYVLKGNYSFELNLSDISSGVYSCKMILEDNKVIIKRIIISK